MEKRRMCPQCRAFIKTSDRVCPYCDAEVGPRARDRLQSTSGSIGGFIPHARFTTSIILLVNFGMFAATALYAMGGRSGGNFMDLDIETLVRFGAMGGRAIEIGQWWRLITAGFLHGGLIHIMMNSWVLFDLGATVEETYGAARMFVIYFLSTIGGFYASGWWNGGISVGASAGIFGLIGAMIALGMKHRSPLGSAIRGMYIRWAVYGLLMGLIPGLHVDNAAHIGGLVAGFAVSYVADTPGLIEGWAERLWKVSAYLCIVITGVAFLQMYLYFSRLGG